MVDYGVLAVEMEASALYTLAAKHGRRALAICTVSDHIVTGEETTSQEREDTLAPWSRSRSRLVSVSVVEGGSRPRRLHQGMQVERHIPGRAQHGKCGFDFIP